MNKQDLKKYFPRFIIETRRFVLRKHRRFKKFLHNYGNSYFFKISTKNESFFIEINPFRNGCVDEGIELEGCWEPELLNTLKKLIKKDDTFLDVGANIGYHSVAIASAFPEARVFSFEPQEFLCKQIENSLSKNDLNNVTVFKVGLSDVREDVSIHIPEENVGGSSVIKGLNNHPAFKKSAKIKLETLDSYIPIFTKVNVIKIDVEGLEPNVLRGGRELISKYRPVIVMEFSPIIYQYSNPKIAYELINLVQEFDYDTYDINFNSINLIEWMKESDHSMKGQIDIICIPKK